MFFNSLEFIFIFLPITIICYFLLATKGGRTGQIVLTGASLIFYALLTPDYLPLLLVSIFFNFGIGKLLIGSLQEGQNYHWKKVILFSGIIGDLGILGYYKYFNFAIVNLDSAFNLTIPVQNIVLPLGISFFTFTQIAFLADTYQGKVENINFLSYMQFVTFFPHLIAGPIYHHADIIPQFENDSDHGIRWEHMNLGIFFFFFGLAKKVILADTLAGIASPIFISVAQGGTPMFIEAWMGALAYTLQLYFDFSGYSDMAIGIALMFNIHFPINFYSPYKVTSVIDFWRSWHITLSNWLRDYLYIPLGGSRFGFPAHLRNLLITMVLGGLWHGAGWTFVAWGGLHGVYLVINHLWRRTGIILHSYICWAVTFFAIIIGWVFFRADSIKSAIVMMKGMSGLNGLTIPPYISAADILWNETPVMIAPAENVINIFIIGIGLAIVLFLPNLIEMTQQFQPALIDQRLYRVKKINPLNISFSYRQSVKWGFIVAIVAASALVSLQTTSEFLYFQF